MVVVGDLVARFRSDTTDLQRGGQVARQELKATEQQAQQTTRALEIMAQAASKANPGQGNAAQILQVFQRANVQPTAAALAQAAREMENTAAAAQKAVEPARAVAKAAADHADGWKASESQVVRFATGLVGIGLGISLVGGAAKLLHDTIGAVIDSQTAWERGLVRVNALYGNMAPRIVALSQAQAAIPGVISGQEELLQANTAAGFLTTRYGVSPTLTGRLTGQAAQISGLFLQNDAGQRQALQDAFREYAQTGGGAGILESTLGRPFDPLSLARRLGYSSEAGLQALTPSQLATARAQLAIANASEVTIQGSNEGRGLLDLRRDAEQNFAQAQGALQNRLEGNANDDPRLRALITSETPRNALEAEQQQQQLAELTAREESYQKAVEAAEAALQANSEALADNERQLKEANDALAKLGVEAGGAAAKLLTFTGSLEDRYSIGRGDVAAQAQAAVALRAVGPNPLIARTPAEMGVAARETAEQQAYQSYVADRARQTQRDASSAIRQFLQSQVQFGPGENRPAAQRALDEIQRRYLANTVSGQAQQAGAFAQRAQAEAQSTLGEISVRQDERRLEVAERMAGYRHDALTLEGQLTPLILAQANLQDRIAVAARDNLQSRRALITAQQAALPSQFALSSMDYEQQRLELRAEVSRASVRRGDAPTEDIADLRAQYRNLELGRPELELQHLDQSRAVDLVQQQREQEDLARQQRLTDLEQEGRSLQDQQIPLEQQLRATEAREQSVQRTLDLLALQDVAQQTAAGHAVNSAQLLAIQAGEADRAAQDMAAGLELGATRAERQAAALERSQTAMSSIFAMTTQQQDVDARIANGLGAGGLGPSAGQSPTPVFHINVSGGSVQQMKDQVHQEVENALNQFFAGSNTTGAPAGVGAAGAGR
jgi:hypothetical protein